MQAVLRIAGLIAVLAAPASAGVVQPLPQAPIPQNVAVSALPTCNASTSGWVYRVTDSLLPALNVTVIGGGAVSVVVRCNATNWVVGQ